MSLKSKVPISICLLLTFSICIYSAQVSSVHAWAWDTHRFVDTKAIELMPDNLDWFFSTYEDIIVDYSVLPDQWKSIDPYEQYRHWYHVDDPEGENEYYRGGLPNNWTMLDKGVLPWAVEDNFATLVQSLEDENWEHAAQMMGVISHYIADASMPLHATEDYNPGGNHGAFEGTVDDHLYEITLDLSGYVPQELDNIFNSTMELLEESYGYVDVVSYYLNQDILWNDELKTIVENRLSSCTRLMANIWYTGMVQAGLVSPPDLVSSWYLVGFTGENTPDNLFQGLNYYTDYYLFWYLAPGGPYMLQGPDEVLKDNLGYWVWINRDNTVTTSGTPPGSRDIYLENGWNLVSFPVVNGSTTPNNIFTGLNYYTDYYLYYWNAPGGPYGLQDPDGVIKDNLGYWVWINQDKTVTVP